MVTLRSDIGIVAASTAFYLLVTAFSALLARWLPGVASPLLPQLFAPPPLAAALLFMLPALASLAVCLHLSRLRVPAVLEIETMLRRSLLPILEATPWPGWALLALGAGVGEEALFRGVLLPAAQHALRSLGAPTAWALAAAASSVIFGLLHAVTPLYFWWATGAGLLFAVELQVTGSLSACVFTHALYDLLAFCAISHYWKTDPKSIAVAAVAAKSPHTIGQTTLTSWLLSLEKSGATDRELATLLTCVASACARVSSLVARAPLAGMTGTVTSGASNASGDEQKKLDVIANDVFVAAVRDSGRASVLVSEEEEAPVALSANGAYVCAFDPIDGSSNIDASVCTGSIFAVYRSREECKVEGDWTAAEQLEKCLLNVQQSGDELAAAGYCLYSSSTVLMLTVRTGVYGFTFDRQRGEFLLSHDNISLPDGKAAQRILSGNLGNVGKWSAALRAFVTTLQNEKKPYSYRYIGALVGDFHRTLLYGGLWLYPPDSSAPKGKARLLYEIAPMALLAEQAGGAAVWGERAEKRVLEVVPASTHERCPMFVGSLTDVDKLKAYLAAASSADVATPEAGR